MFYVNQSLARAHIIPTISSRLAVATIQLAADIIGLRQSNFLSSNTMNIYYLVERVQRVTKNIDYICFSHFSLER